MTALPVPELSLVVLVGITGSGKSTFARAHFRPTEVISSDFCRGLVADDENDQSATPAAFELLEHIAGLRLAAGRLTVVDATNVQPDARRRLVALAREHDVLPVAIVLDLPERLCAERNMGREDRGYGPHVIRRQRAQLRRNYKGLPREGFRTVHTLRSPDEVAAAEITRTRLYNDLRHETGPFDVIGDVHGCRAELEQLLLLLGYAIDRDAAGRPVGARHSRRRAVFLGDLVDRGPDTPGVLRLVMGMVAAGSALCVQGNHEARLLRALRGRNVQRTHGLAETMEQLAREPDAFRAEVERFIDGLISHYVLDGGRLVVAHAGLVERYHGRASGRVREFCLYGQTTGETDEYGLPVRYPWAEEYRGRAMVLYGHTPVPEPEWLNNTLCLDTGCVFGGRLTALNYPERTVVSVPAATIYHPPARPFPAAPPAPPASLESPALPDPSAPLGSLASPGPPASPVLARREPDVLDIGDVSGSRVLETAYLPRIRVQEAHAAAALEVMSRFALDPRWLLYLPPTMSPVATSTRDDLLEHPDQAFSAYRADGITSLLCEEKHMGSRAVVLLCRTPQAAHSRFGIPTPAAPVRGPAPSAPAPAGPAAAPPASFAASAPSRFAVPAPSAPAPAGPAAAPPASSAASAPSRFAVPALSAPAPAGPAAAPPASSAASAPSGAIWTRTGRPFFPPEQTEALIAQLRAAAEQVGLFDELNTPWLLLDAELLPWNVKAAPLLRDQYAALAAAASLSLPAAVAALEQAAARPMPGDGAELAALLARTGARAANADAFTEAYLRYCWPVDGLAGIRVAPFQLLATEGAVYHDRPHLWHLALADRLAAARPDLIATTRRIPVDTADPKSIAEATQWWEGLTASGGEGMVVKPAANLPRSSHPSGRAPDTPAPDAPGPALDAPAPDASAPDASAPNAPGPAPDLPGHTPHGRNPTPYRSPLPQPGLKVRGREYLRLIYGPDYTEPANLARLRQRAVARKRSLALREYALGLEALDRAARGEPLWRIHECVFAILALESEPVDPRL